MGFSMGFFALPNRVKKRKNPVIIEITGFNAGAPRGIRTHNLLIRSLSKAFHIVSYHLLF